MGSLLAQLAVLLLHALDARVLLLDLFVQRTNGGECDAVRVDRVIRPIGVAEAEGRDITTVEGIAQGDHLHPVQQKFLEHAALQCGFCTPGFIVAAKALLDENLNPTEEETRYWLAGNLCRCTGYDKIIRAVLDAAAVMRQEAAR